MIIVFVTVVAAIYVLNFMFDWIDFEHNIFFVLAIAWLLSILIQLA